MKRRRGRASELRDAWAFIALFLLCTFFAVTADASNSLRYAVATTSTPVLNTHDFTSVFGGTDGKALATDSCGQIRALEFIALPGTPFRIEAVLDGPEFPVYRVITDDYPYPSRTGYYIDSRFVDTSETPVQPRPRKLPKRNTILARLSSAVGTTYVWGGNRRDGVPEMMAFFPLPPGQRPDTLTENRWTLRGLDCSGLLYESTDGYTPRNTSALVDYGDPVPIAGLDEARMAERLRPLDLIVWKGHVMIVYDRNRIIESRLDCGGKNGGVAFRGLRETLRELLQSRSPLDSWTDAKVNGKKVFVIRRWYPADGATPAPK